jgi:hypothetical protein
MPLGPIFSPRPAALALRRPTVACLSAQRADDVLRAKVADQQHEIGHALRDLAAHAGLALVDLLYGCTTAERVRWASASGGSGVASPLACCAHEHDHAKKGRPRRDRHPRRRARPRIRPPHPLSQRTRRRQDRCVFQSAYVARRAIQRESTLTGRASLFPWSGGIALNRLRTSGPTPTRSAENFSSLKHRPERSSHPPRHRPQCRPGLGGCTRCGSASCDRRRPSSVAYGSNAATSKSSTPSARATRSTFSMLTPSPFSSLMTVWRDTPARSATCAAVSRRSRRQVARSSPMRRWPRATAIGVFDTDMDPKVLSLRL